MNEVTPSQTDRKALRFAMNLSLFVGLLMFIIKVSAYLLTGSAAILSDAAESVVHVIAVAFAAFSLRLSERPPDSDHPYGHNKISFFSAGFEGGMIFLAALYIIASASLKWWRGLELENLGLGTWLTAAAMVINGALGAYLVWIGRKKRSIILEANGKHVLTDCWTSLGVVIGLLLTLSTGWLPWDPICAILVALNILWSGGHLIRQAVAGLMDVANPEIDRKLREVLADETRGPKVSYHGLKHRDMGNAYWIELHLLFPAKTLLGDAHERATKIEEALKAALEGEVHVTSHLEALEDHERVHHGEKH